MDVGGEGAVGSVQTSGASPTAPGGFAACVATEDDGSPSSSRPNGDPAIAGVVLTASSGGP